MKAHGSKYLLAVVVLVTASSLVGCGGGGGYGGGGGGTATPGPGAFMLSSPSGMATGVSTTTTLTWNASLYATLYTVEVSTSSAFSPIAASAAVAATSWPVTPALLPATTYFWRVTATNAYGIYTAPTFSFST